MELSPEAPRREALQVLPGGAEPHRERFSQRSSANMMGAGCRPRLWRGCRALWSIRGELPTPASELSEVQNVGLTGRDRVVSADKALAAFKTSQPETKARVRVAKR